MNFRRVAIVLAGITAAGFLAAGSAAATTTGDEAGAVGGKSSSSAAFSYENLGGPYGITRTHGSFEESMGYFGYSGDHDN
ncbi:hypothetical protein V2S66_34280 [Streptomyces sp. V4-01]|uniref:Uncharacterized protein n=1 Tax=Actinacidiphila polyblastidii TaxID=3110430 RepID=A0ABU7PMF5_9ACTN|nr:hypothetical protein [Streptomyces sp. V4-01]